MELEADRQKPMAMAALAGFILLLALLVWAGVALVRANLGPATVSMHGGGGPRSGSTPLPAITDGDLPPPPNQEYTYIARTGENGWFTAEVTPNFNFKYTKTTFTGEDGTTVPLHAYTAGGGLDQLDGFGVTVYEGILTKRRADMSEADVVELVAKDLFRKTHCTVNLNTDVTRNGVSVMHMEGKGWNDANGKNYWMTVEAFAHGEHVYLAFSAGYDGRVIGDSRSDHFFETFEAGN